MIHAGSRLALWIGAIMLAAGILGWLAGWDCMPLIIIGAVVLVSACIEPAYGLITHRAPAGGQWRSTGEKFVDPENGKLVTVWYDPASGERRYVAEGDTLE